MAFPTDTAWKFANLMCGRTACTLAPARIIKDLKVNGKWHGQDRFKPNYNVAPSSLQPIVCSVDGERVVFMMQWGLVPSWTKAIEGVQRSINARSESIHEKPSFRSLVGRKRCVVVTDGYYEWFKQGKRRMPYFFRFPEGKIVTMAGLYDVWRDADGEPLYSYVILTTNASAEVRFVHDRMPVLLDEADVDKWLDMRTSIDDAMLLLRPYTGTLLVNRVSDAVNKVGNNVPECQMVLDEHQIAEADAAAAISQKRAAPEQKTTLHSFFTRAPKQESLQVISMLLEGRDDVPSQSKKVKHESEVIILDE
eukprot:TRINITY_DN14321_c0_g1_i1.p1 TRINITY_DN14321_c0_g1~~TRINITY_DN14321_c0_g1_i1.p1  ORF type:complete len:308 (-),score=45.34 TRINITY_DN14321_c0_g1_i1:28-951(-)